MHRILDNNSGVTIMSAIFILLIMTLTSKFIVDISTDSMAGNNIVIQGGRAVYAARSGVAWGLTTATKNSACPAATTIPITQSGLAGFSVYVTCTSPSAGHYNVTAVATYGIFGQFGYVTRTATGSK